MSNVETMIRPSLLVARAVYFTDVTNPRARVIPLGAFSEIMLPSVHGLALKARSRLATDEVALISPLLRDRLAEPFTFLREQFDEAWKVADPGNAIKFLSGRHTAALSILAPREAKEAGWWRSLMTAAEDAVALKLSNAIDQEFGDLLKEYGEPTAPKRKLIEVDDERIAA